jgi:hypothetical protein
VSDEILPSEALAFSAAIDTVVHEILSRYPQSPGSSLYSFARTANSIASHAMIGVSRDPNCAEDVHWEHAEVCELMQRVCKAAGIA